MSIQLLFKQATGNISQEKFWVGFVVRYLDLVDSKSIPCCRAVEITSMGLTMAAEKRERDGFSFPIFVHHKNRFDKKVAPRFYVGIEDPDRVFADCNFIESVDFVFAAKDGLTLAELGGATSVTVFSPAHTEGLELELHEAHQAARGVRFSLIALDNGVRKFCDAGPVFDIDSYPGDIDSYCQQHAARLTPSGSASPRPMPTASPAPTPTPAPAPALAPSRPQAGASVQVTKGGNVSLTKMVPELSQLSLQLGWSEAGLGMDLDASAFMLGETGKVRGDGDFIYYGQPASACSSVVLAAHEERSAQQKARLQIDLAGLPRAVERVVLCVTIHEADARRQYFSQVNHAFVCILDADSGHALCRFDLVDDYSTETSMIFGEIYRYKDDWKFKAVGQGFSGGLASMCGQFGIEVN